MGFNWNTPEEVGFQEYFPGGWVGISRENEDIGLHLGLTCLPGLTATCPASKTPAWSQDNPGLTPPSA